MRYALRSTVVVRVVSVVADSGVRAESDLFPLLVRQAKLSDKVVDWVTEMIVSHRLSAGDALPSERELAERFGVSRTVIREALRSLSAKGLIETRSGRGMRVAAVSPTAVNESMTLYLRGASLDYGQVHEVRATLEVTIAGLAAERATSEQIETLMGICEEMRTSTGRAERAALLDVEFHRGVADATGNRLYLVVLDAIGHVLLDVRRRMFSDPAVILYGVGAHREILARIEARDSEGASAAMAAHLAESRRRWLEVRDSDLS